MFKCVQTSKNVLRRRRFRRVFFPQWVSSAWRSGKMAARCRVGRTRKPSSSAAIAVYWSPDTPYDYRHPWSIPTDDDRIRCRKDFYLRTLFVVATTLSRTLDYLCFFLFSFFLPLFLLNTTTGCYIGCLNIKTLSGGGRGGWSFAKNE